MRYLETTPLVDDEINRQTEQFDQLLRRGIVPHLRVIRDKEGAEEIGVRSYTGALRQHAERLVAPFVSSVLSVERLISLRTVDSDDVMRSVDEANEDDAVHSVLVMSPTINDYAEIAGRIKSAKDVDRMNPATRESGLGPCTPQAVRETLDHYGLWTPGLRHVLVGKGRTVGAFVDEDLHDLHGDAYDRQVRVITKSNEDQLSEAMVGSKARKWYGARKWKGANVAIVAAGQPDQIDDSMYHPELGAVVGVCIGDIDDSMYRIEGELLVTPRHNDENYFGIGRHTSAIAHRNNLGAAALTVGIDFGNYAGSGNRA